MIIEIMLKNNIQLSMTDGYASYQNAIVETVFKILKVVYFKRQKFKNINVFLLHMNHGIWKCWIILVSASK
ncbi:hypothetical protein [Spiroplasma endosymbiont of Lasioglossum malachurum]|uniref:hypothetical protein n=1 Tax=Spiroplasma endosymbiont of Lasioglossum malachurum TaxID=3066319 RepID=UPI0030D5A43D